MNDDGEKCTIFIRTVRIKGGENVRFLYTAGDDTNQGRTCTIDLYRTGEDRECRNQAQNGASSPSASDRCLICGYLYRDNLIQLAHDSATHVEDTGGTDTLVRGLCPW